jgi:hypothetical protein
MGAAFSARRGCEKIVAVEGYGGLTPVATSPPQALAYHVQP